jgi:uncharacterized lipoprotein YddW (UPF0748 family)
VFSAWPASLGTPPVAEGPVQHVLRDHPEWLAVNQAGESADGGYRYLTPGNPAVRAHIAAVARDLLEHYDVDGLHLDRIRTAGQVYSHDAVTEAAFDNARAQNASLTFDQFMTSQVTQMVSDLYDVVLDVRPTALLSASVWGIHTPLPGCNTSQGKRDYHQDSWDWTARGIIDALVPMSYWDIEEGCTNWSALTDGFLDNVADRSLWMGHLGLDGGEFRPDRLAARITLAREKGAQGTVLFASSYLDEDQERWSTFRGDEANPGPFFDDVPLASVTHR